MKKKELIIQVWMLDTIKLCSLSSELKEWVDYYTNSRDWEETQDCDNSIISKYENKNKDYNILFNPRNSSIKLELISALYIKLEILDVKGRFIEKLFDSYKKSGKYIIIWDKHKYSSGIYYLKLTVDNKTLIQKSVIIR